MILVDRLTEIKNSTFDWIRTKKESDKPKKFKTSILPLVSTTSQNFAPLIQTTRKVHTKSFVITNLKIDEIPNKHINIKRNSCIDNHKLVNSIQSMQTPIHIKDKTPDLSNIFNMNAKNNIKFNLVLNKKVVSNNESKNSRDKISVDNKDENKYLSKSINNHENTQNSETSSKLSLFNSLKSRINDKNIIIMNNFKIHKNSQLNSIIERSNAYSSNTKY